MTQRKPKNEDWETFVERQIRAAQEAGEFDDLPGLGQPLEGIDEPYDEMWWVKKKLRREELSLLPPALQIRRDVEDTLQSALELGSEAAVRKAIEALNERIRAANLRAAWGPPSTTLPLDTEQVISEWKARRPGNPSRPS